MFSFENQSSREVWPPQPGLFALRLARASWRVPARIVLSDIGWQAEIDETLYSPHRKPEHAEMVARIWHHGLLIDPATYEWLLAVKHAARLSDPEHPSLHPMRPIDPRITTPLAARPAR